MLLQIKDGYQFVLFTGEESPSMLRVKGHPMIALTSPHTVASDHRVRCWIDHRKDVLVLKVDVDLASNRVVLRHPCFTVEMQSLDDLVLLNINNGLCLPALVRNVKLVKRSGIRTAIGLGFGGQLLDHLHPFQIDHTDRVVSGI